MPVGRRSFVRLVSALPGAAIVGSLASPAAGSRGGTILYEEQAFETRIRVAGADLLLNGTGVRQVAWFKGYLAALYLTAAASTAEQAVAMPGPKRIQMRMLHGVPAVEFSKAMRKGIARNSPPAQHSSLAGRVERFSRQIDAEGQVREKDIVNLDFDPARGLVMLINSRQSGDPIPGPDFYSALLLSFIGERPYDKRMRSGLLGKPEN